MGNVEQVVAEYVVDAQYSDLPSEIVALVKEKILDTIGVIVAGSSAPGCDLIEDQVTYWAGKPEATVMVSGARLPTTSVVQIHGSWAHADEFCDSDDRNALKGSATVIPLALAFGELKSCSGQELILATAVGLDLGCRIGLAIRPQPASILRDEGVFSGAAAGAKILGLDAEGVLNAMGVGYSQLAGASMEMSSPSLTKRLLPGQVNRAAAWGVALAARGFPTGREFLIGERAYFRQFRGQEGSAEELTDGLGQRFEIAHCPKPYPSGRFCHTAVDAAIELRQANDFNADEIERVTIEMSPRAMASVGGGLDGHSLDAKQVPKGVVDAQTSTPYNVAVALLRGRVTLDDFTEDAIRDPVTLDLTSRCVETVYPKDDFPLFITPSKVVLRMKDGAVMESRVEYAKGNPMSPLTGEELDRKFWACIDNCARALDIARVRRAVDLLSDLENVEDIGVIPPLLISAR